MTPSILLLLAGLSIQAPPQAPAAAQDPVAQAYSLFLQGRDQDDKGDLDAAIAAFRKVLALQPTAVYVQAELAVLYARSGKAPEALAAALDALKMDPANRTAHRVMGFVQSAMAESATDPARQANLAAEAIHHFEQALAGGANDPSSQLSLGRLYVVTGDNARAIPILKDFLDAQPDYSEAVLLLSDAYEASHDVKDAVAVVQPLVKDQPADIRARARLAELDEAAALWSDAAVQWGELANRTPKPIPYRLRRATALVNAGNIAQGRDELQAIAGDSPTDPAIWSLLSEVERRGGNIPAAEDDARKAIALNPKQSDGPFALAAAEMTKKDYRAAAAALDALVASPAPDDLAGGTYVRAASRQALAFDAGGDHASALRVLEAAHQRVPADDDLGLTLASTYDRAGALDKAEALYRVILGKDPANASALNDFGYMLAEHGMKLDEAVTLLKRALATDPDNPSYLDSLGWAYVKGGQAAEARPLVEKATAASPRNSVMFDHLGEVYFQLKRYKDAADAWDRAIAGDQDGVDVAAITKKRDHARQLAGKSGE